LATIGNNFQTFCGYFHVFQVVEHIRTITLKNKTSKKSKISIFGQF
jgi:hypothetical protein